MFSHDALLSKQITIFPDYVSPSSLLSISILDIYYTNDACLKSLNSFYLSHYTHCLITNDRCSESQGAGAGCGFCGADDDSFYLSVTYYYSCFDSTAASLEILLPGCRPGFDYDYSVAPLLTGFSPCLESGGSIAAPPTACWRSDCDPLFTVESAPVVDEPEAPVLAGSVLSKISIRVVMPSQRPYPVMAEHS